MKTDGSVQAKGAIMLRFVTFLFVCLTTLPTFCQPTSKWVVGTITDVRTHQTAEPDAFGTVSYDVSVKVGDTVYVVLYTPPLGEQTVKYVAGRDLLVSVGKSVIRYNDMLGQTHEVLIESQRPASNLTKAKRESGGAQ
jgi:hypothetical protein